MSVICLSQEKQNTNDNLCYETIYGNLNDYSNVWQSD